MVRSGPVPVKTAEDLEQVFDVPVTVSAVLGSSRIAVGDLLRITPGVLEPTAASARRSTSSSASGGARRGRGRRGAARRTMTEIIKADR